MPAAAGSRMGRSASHGQGAGRKAFRHNTSVDGVFDFATTMADPNDPQQLNPAYDSGDHLHPNDAGYQAMANAVDLALLTTAAPALPQRSDPSPPSGNNR
ncbi:SGNH/GDSL hydrolase family protein [Streptomyces sp. NBC_00996]|uniref:SGNH/GDSL hydrolase family protein n=1 Tax=Streptomyces sp. NBC_00996 TaxID=2903710 RepID=UPI003864967D